MQQRDGEAAPSTVAIGDALEDRIADLLQSEIDAGNFWAKRECCTLYRKRGYYSSDRESNIVFDIAIEIRLPGEQDVSLVILVECKNYSHPVPVDDVEEFYEKIEQVTGANVKGILATRSALQKGAFTFAKSKRLAVIRYFDGSQFKWQLKRSASAVASSDAVEDSLRIEAGLTQSSFRSHFYDLYCLSPARLTNSLQDLFGDLFSDSGLEQEETRQLANCRRRRRKYVPFIAKDVIEDASAKLLDDIGHKTGPTSLDRIVNLERE